MVLKGQIRPVNLRTDLAPLADLIELVFSPTMDDGGRAAIREMRYLSRIGVGLSLIGQLNEMALGIKMGYVWLDGERLIGNVSVYPAQLPNGQRNVWIIANVGVHPDFQGQGIARQLMEASLQMLADRGGQEAILQVDYDNERAIRLYEGLGFRQEGAWTTWRRSSLSPVPSPVDDQVFITRRRRSEWQTEMQLAQQVRPNVQGGLGWQKPLTPELFVKPWLKSLMDWFSMNSTERLIVRTDDERDILASLWIENTFGSLTTRMILFAHPEHRHALNAMLNNAIRRYRSSSIVVEHPMHEETVGGLLSRYRFIAERTVRHMRLKL